MGLFQKLLGTVAQTFKIGKATLDASGLSEPATLTLGAGSVSGTNTGDQFTSGSPGTNLYLSAIGGKVIVTSSSANVTQDRSIIFDPVNGSRTVFIQGDVTIQGTHTGTCTGTNTGDQFTSTTASRLLGRGSAAGGAAQEITLGTKLSMSGTTLNASGGKLVDRGYGEYTAHTTISTTIPADDTIPQSNEGTELIAVEITPKATTNRIRIFAAGVAGFSVANGFFTMALFKDSDADALAANFSSIAPTAGYVSGVGVLSFEHSPNTTSKVTYKLRTGVASGSMYTNGSSTQRYLGGASRWTMTVDELEP